MKHGVPCILQARSGGTSSVEADRLNVPERVLRNLGFPDGAPVTLCTPGFRVAVRLVRMSTGSRRRSGSDPDIPRTESSGTEQIFVSQTLVRRLALPVGLPLRIRRSAPDEIQIGPFVGIFCQRYPGPSLYGPQTRFFRRLIEIGREMGMFVYIFETGDVDRRRAAIAGSTWVPRQGWVRVTCPLPHVFYDRGMVTQSVMRVHQWLRLRGVKQFNGYVGSKLWVYRLLADDPKLARYIPPTKVLRHTSDLVHMVKKHGTVYVKSAGGGKGIGIWVVSGQAGHGYTYRFTDARARIRRGRTHDPSLIVQRLLAAPRQPWFIQPRLNLLDWRGGIFDARILVQRDGQGVLGVTGTGARIGPKGSIISNIHGGGHARALPPLLEQCLGLSEQEAKAFEQRIEDIALASARLIDKAIRKTGTVGELGIDIAIDRDGRLWFLEANSRTGRNVFLMSGMHDRATTAMLRPLQYAEHVAGFA